MRCKETPYIHNPENQQPQQTIKSDEYKIKIEFLDKQHQT